MVIELEAIKDGEKSFHVLKALSTAITSIPVLQSGEMDADVA